MIKQANIKKACRHDYKNAIKIGKIDYKCPLCGKILDPLEWFFMNSFEFVDVGIVDGKTTKKSKRAIVKAKHRQVHKNRNEKGKT